MKRHFLWSVLGSAFLLALTYFHLVVPRKLAFDEINSHWQEVAAISPDKYLLAIDKYRKTLGQISGFCLIAALLISVWNLRSNGKAKVAGRFAKALDDLGATRETAYLAASEIRSGGVAELERIGDHSPRERRMICLAFNTYLRHYAFWGNIVKQHYEPTIWRMKETQAMLTVLGRWGTGEFEGAENQLTDLDLRHLILEPHALFVNVVADRSHFEYAQLSEVNFRNARFHEAVFSGANLRDTDFRNAKLTNCTFIGTGPNADRWGWNVAELRFTWSSPLAEADMEGADLQGADLTGALITEAQFRSAKTDQNTKQPSCFSQEFLSPLPWRRRDTTSS